MWKLLSALLVGALAQQTSLELGPLRDVSLPDQYGVEDCLGAHEGNVAVVFVVSAERLRSVKAWEESLRERFEELDTLRVADVVTNSPTTLERVASKLRERVPEGVSVLIDLDRLWATELELDTEEPNLFIVDARGALVAHYRGRRDPVRLALVTAQLERLLVGP